MREAQPILRACGAAAALGVLACLLATATPADAKFKVRLRSTSKSVPAPSAPKPHLPASASEAPKGPGKVDVARPSAAPDVHVNVRSRGFFDRLLDWLFWRRPAPAPAQAPPPAPAQASPVAPASAPPVAQAPAPRPPLPVPAPATAPAPPAAPAPVVPVVLPVPPPLAPVPASTAQREEKHTGKTSGAPPAPARQTRQEATPRGYVLHLRNGSTIPVAFYEDAGDQVIIPQYGGSYGLSKSSIAKIEEVRDDGRAILGGPKR